ncbi:MAG: AraC family transcriptional regulator [Actinobacteria bacterium 21-73-9]|nr:MAG: AraC family transcriptional regulator [Actinobacteria bacterium 21-73-9]
MDREFARALRVGDLARDAAMSTGHFARSFTRAYAESPYSYLMTRRVERAMALLRAGASVTATAAAVGYGSLGTFATRFTELVGEPPGAYARRWRGATLDLDPCVARQVTRPVRNREARAGDPV